MFRKLCLPAVVLLVLMAAASSCSTRLGEPSNVYLETRLSPHDVAPVRNSLPDFGHGGRYGYPRTLRGAFPPGGEEVLVRLHSDGSMVQGNFYLGHDCIEKQVRGTVGRNGELLLNELDEWGFKVAAWQGKFDSLQVFGGYRSLPDGSLLQPLRLMPVEAATYRPDVWPPSGGLEL